MPSWTAERRKQSCHSLLMRLQTASSHAVRSALRCLLGLQKNHQNFLTHSFRLQKASWNAVRIACEAFVVLHRDGVRSYETQEEGAGSGLQRGGVGSVVKRK